MIEWAARQHGFRWAMSVSLTYKVLLYRPGRCAPLYRMDGKIPRGSLMWPHHMVDQSDSKSFVEKMFTARRFQDSAFRGPPLWSRPPVNEDSRHDER